MAMEDLPMISPVVKFSELRSVSQRAANKAPWNPKNWKCSSGSKWIFFKRTSLRSYRRCCFFVQRIFWFNSPWLTCHRLPWWMPSKFVAPGHEEGQQVLERSRLSPWSRQREGRPPDGGWISTNEKVGFKMLKPWFHQPKSSGVETCRKQSGGWALGI